MMVQHDGTAGAPRARASPATRGAVAAPGRMEGQGDDGGDRDWIEGGLDD